MSQEAKRTRSQYLNGIAVALVSTTMSAVIAGAPLWLVGPAVAGSAALHVLAVRATKGR